MGLYCCESVGLLAEVIMLSSTGGTVARIKGSQEDEVKGPRLKSNARLKMNVEAKRMQASRLFMPKAKISLATVRLGGLAGISVSEPRL
jgi:hypothetical protein